MLVGFIGIGSMGGPMARNILRAGEDLMVWARTPARMEPFAAQGAMACTGPKDMAGVDVLCTCLPMPGDVTGLCLGGDGLYSAMKPGAVHVEMSTIDPATGQALADGAHAKGIGYIQCPLGKTPMHAARGESPLFIGGDREAIGCLMPLFEKIGLPRDVGTIQAACAVKLLSNLIGMANMAVLAEGLRVGAACGMDLNQLIDLLQDTGARSYQMDLRGPWVATMDYEPRFRVELAVKDMRLGCAMSGSLGCETPMLEQALAWYRRAMEEGQLGRDFCAVFEAMK